METIIFYILILVLVGLGIKMLVSRKDSEDEDTITYTEQINKSQQVTSQAQLNKVVNVTLTGGIIGLLGVSPQNELNNRIKKENANGWRVVQIIPAASGNVFLYLLRIILLIITALLYTTTNGYYVVMEKNIPDNI